MVKILKRKGGTILKNKLRKSSTDSSIHGVCGGIAEYYGMSSFAVRLIFFLIPTPANLIIYLIFSNTMEESPQSL